MWQSYTDGETPLFWASIKGHVEVVKMLLAHLQINVNQGKTTDGATPLFVSYQNKHVEGQDYNLGNSPLKTF